MNIVFTFLYAVSYSCHHPLSILKGKEFLDDCTGHNHVRKKSSPWRLFVGRVCLYRKHKQRATISFMQCEKLIIYVSFFMMRESNHDLCGGVTELHGFCGR